MYVVYLNVTYKPSIKEPEGETIAKELLQRMGIDIGVRAGKCLQLYIEAESEEEAARKALEVAREARLGNPNVHMFEVIKVSKL
ncbi:MAG: phosphoribosylformylglycinamidine synthase subunit PurS [Pyrobaculum sp.]